MGASALTAHGLDEGLIGEKFPAINGRVKRLIDSVALAFLILRRVDAALGANGMGALHGYSRTEIGGDARLSATDGSHQAGQTTPHDYDLRLSHLVGRPAEDDCR